MEQRVYRGNLDPQGLADHLVQQYDPQQNLQAQQIGQTGTYLVQIGRGDVPQDLRNAITVAIAPTSDESGLTVTMGQQQWLTPQTASFAAAMGLVAVLITPFALFALLWPLSDAISSTTLPIDIWDTIDTFVASKGGSLGQSQTVQHPHNNQPV